ncbi:MAG: MoxR family ATPase [Candidatus Dadabacteria bacterium]|nr:MAG: MoxR family ATPase [Candidatus Dadabacteria bacterium]
MQVQSVAQSIKESVQQVVYGHSEAIDYITGAFLLGGHVLIEGPPGIAKTLLVKTFAASLGLKFKRIQFTPDLMPADVTGVSIFDRETNTFRFVPGPVFADVLLADEINRTPPKTQSALLEAMQERSVTVDGAEHSLSDNFFVLATQNPIEHEGTFPLPEAQLDRFLFKLILSYPGKDDELKMIERFSSGTGEDLNSFDAVNEIKSEVSLEDIRRARQEIRQVLMSAAISDYIYRIVEASRSHPLVILGASPRAALNLALAAKMKAAFDGRGYVIPDDVKEVAYNVLIHRLVTRTDLLEESYEASGVIEQIITKTPLPQGELRTA